MKRFYKVLATACAMVFIAASPMASMTTHAIGFNADAPYHETNDDVDTSTDDYWDNLNVDDSSSAVHLPVVHLPAQRRQILVNLLAEIIGTM